MEAVSIVPCDMITTVKLTGFTFDVKNFIPNTSIEFRVVLYSDTVPKKIELIELTGDDYKMWSNDDKYVIKYIANKLGLTLC